PSSLHGKRKRNPHPELAARRREGGSTSRAGRHLSRSLGRSRSLGLHHQATNKLHGIPPSSEGNLRRHSPVGRGDSRDEYVNFYLCFLGSKRSRVMRSSWYSRISGHREGNFCQRSR